MFRIKVKGWKMDNNISFEYIYKKYRKRIENYCQFRLNSDYGIAEDLTTEVFQILFLKWDDLDSHDESRILTWLYNAAIIKTREYWRKSKDEPLLLSLEDFNNDSDIALHNELIYEDTRFQEEQKYQVYIRQIKETLSLKDKKTFECIVEKKYTIAQTAKELNSSEVTIKVRWYRLRQKIKPFISDILK